MINEIIEVWKNNKDTISTAPGHTCRYCNKQFKRESTLIAHQCEPKRRWQQEKEVGVQFGLQAYLRFYELTQGSAKLKSYSNFVESSFYIAFVKFGRHMVDIRAVNPRAFIDHVIKNNKKLDTWCYEAVYLEYLQSYMRKESAQDALERGLLEMQKYAEEHSELSGGFRDYFRHGNSNKICYHISNGRISPWVVYNCNSGIEFLENLSDEQITIVIPWIHPEIWQHRFKDYVADTEWVKSILNQAGL
jgi:hypothetical protein